MQRQLSHQIRDFIGSLQCRVTLFDISWKELKRKLDRPRRHPHHRLQMLIQLLFHAAPAAQGHPPYVCPLKNDDGQKRQKKRREEQEFGSIRSPLQTLRCTLLYIEDNNSGGTGGRRELVRRELAPITTFLLLLSPYSNRYLYVCMLKTCQNIYWAPSFEI